VKEKGGLNAAAKKSFPTEELAGESMSTRTIRNIFAPGVALTLLLAAGNVLAAGKQPSPKQPPKPAAEECLACHSDASLTHDVDGKTVSLHVDP